MTGFSLIIVVSYKKKLIKKTVFSYPPARSPLISYHKMTRTKHISDYRLNIFLIKYIFVMKKYPFSSSKFHSHRLSFQIAIFALIIKLWLPWSHDFNITNLNHYHYSFSFPDAKETASLGMRFCQINTTMVVQSHPIKMGRLWTNRDFAARKTYSNFSLQSSNSLWHAQIKQMFPHIPGLQLDTLEESNFRSKLRLKASNFFIWKLLFKQKKEGCRNI